jgi:monoamine oxidase
MAFGETWDQAGTMMQPIGGMDAIARAFARALGTMIRYQAEVVGLRRVGERARVSWRDRRQGSESSMDADFVICTIPLPVLKGIASDFPGPVKRAIEVGANAYVPAVKVAFQAKRRWWETDHQIYGGIPRLDSTVTKAF